MVGEAVEESSGQPFRAEHLGPLDEGQVGGHQDRSTLVTLAEHLEEQLGASLGQGHEAQFVDDQKLGDGLSLIQAGRSVETELAPLPAAVGPHPQVEGGGSPQSDVGPFGGHLQAFDEESSSEHRFRGLELEPPVAVGQGDLGYGDDQHRHGNQAQ